MTHYFYKYSLLLIFLSLTRVAPAWSLEFDGEDIFKTCFDTENTPTKKNSDHTKKIIRKRYKNKSDTPIDTSIPKELTSSFKWKDGETKDIGCNHFIFRTYGKFTIAKYSERKHLSKQSDETIKTLFELRITEKDPESIAKKLIEELNILPGTLLARLNKLLIHPRIPIIEQNFEFVDNIQSIINNLSRQNSATSSNKKRKLSQISE